MPNTTDIAIVNGARTPMGRYCGKLKDFTAQELGAVAAIEAMKRSGVEPGEIDHAVFGNAQQTSGDAIYGARHVALKAGVPIEVPALTVNRLCGSGMQSVVTAAQMIQLGEATKRPRRRHGIHVAGAARYSRHALGRRPGRRQAGRLADGRALRHATAACTWPAPPSSMPSSRASPAKCRTSSPSARRKRADDAAKAGRLAEEITPVALRNRRGEPTGEMFTEDDHRRPETTMESLSKLKPSFGKNGTVTAGNASGIVDGAAATVVMSLDEAQKRNLNPMARIVSWGIAGVDPKIMGSGPVPASRQALKKAGLKLDDIDLIEVNEAFAAQYLAVEKELGLDREKVNVNGGAIALGHPLGATGTRLLITICTSCAAAKPSTA